MKFGIQDFHYVERDLTIEVNKKEAKIENYPYLLISWDAMVLI